MKILSSFSWLQELMFRKLKVPPSRHSGQPQLFTRLIFPFLLAICDILRAQYYPKWFMLLHKQKEEEFHFRASHRQSHFGWMQISIHNLWSWIAMTSLQEVALITRILTVATGIHRASSITHALPAPAFKTSFSQFCSLHLTRRSFLHVYLNTPLFQYSSWPWCTAQMKIAFQSVFVSLLFCLLSSKGVTIKFRILLLPSVLSIHHVCHPSSLLI